MYATHTCTVDHSAQNMRRVVHIEDIKTWGFREVGLLLTNWKRRGKEFSSFWHVRFSTDKKGAVHRYISLNVILICNAKVQMSQLADHQFWYLHVHLVYVA